MHVGKVVDGQDGAKFSQRAKGLRAEEGRRPEQVEPLGDVRPECLQFSVVEADSAASAAASWPLNSAPRPTGKKLPKFTPIAKNASSTKP